MDTDSAAGVREGLPPTLDFWQKMRQRRIDEVVEQVLATANMQRLPEEERKKLLSEQKNPDAVESGAYNEMAWLYKPDSEKRIRRWDRKPMTDFS